VTVHAVRRYQDLVPEAAREFDDARAELIELAAAIWHRYESNPSLEPSITRTGAYQYRGPGPLRMVVVVGRAAGDGKPPIVDVVGVTLRGLGRRAADSYLPKKPEIT
jgi:hypothetical protein